MDRADEKLRELLSDKLSGYSAPVDPGLWAGVQSGIQGVSSIGTVAGFTTKGWLPWVAAAIVGVGITASVVFFDAESPKDTQNQTEEATKQLTNAQSSEEWENSGAPQAVEPESVKKSSIAEQNESRHTDQKHAEGAETSAQASPSTEVAKTNENQSLSEPSIEKQNPSASSKTTSTAASSDRMVITAPKAKFDMVPASGEMMKFGFVPTNITDNCTYLWVFGDGNTSTDVSPEHYFSVAGEYSVSLTVTNENGMSTTEKMTLKAFPQGKLLLPNTFTPDGDGINDTYDIMGLSEYVNLVSLTIANTKGQVVYELSSGRNVWDGTDNFGNNCPMGTYLVVAVAKDQSGEIIKQSGTVYLKR